MFKTTFLESYPHHVKMASKKAKLDSITAEGMVQFCMVVPMKNEPLPWDSEELAALTAYSEGVIQQRYIEAKAAK
jgi:cytochrome c